MNREEDLYRRTLKYFLKPIWEAYLEDASVSEIMIDGIDEVYIERGGKLQETETRFPDNDYLMAAVRNVAQYTGKRITPETSRFDCRLPDGSRVHVVLPPRSRNGIVIAVRKLSRQAIDLDRLVEYKSLTPESREFLSIAVLLHQNIIVSGGTGSGKTSLLNALAGAIPEKQRIIVLEDSTEVKIPREHMLYFEARAADRHGLGQVTIRDLFYSSPAVAARPHRHRRNPGRRRPGHHPGDDFEALRLHVHLTRQQSAGLPEPAEDHGAHVRHRYAAVRASLAAGVRRPLSPTLPFTVCIGKSKRRRESLA